MTRGEIMRMWREKRGLSQLELAELSGVTQKTIWALENNKNNGSVTTVELLSDALGLSIDEYVGHERKTYRGGRDKNG